MGAEHPGGGGEIPAEGVDEDFVLVELEDDVAVGLEEQEKREGESRG